MTTFDQAVGADVVAAAERYVLEVSRITATPPTSLLWGWIAASDGGREFHPNLADMAADMYGALPDELFELFSSVSVPPCNELMHRWVNQALANLIEVEYFGVR